MGEMTVHEYFESGIKDDAGRAGIDTHGLVGLAIVHTMSEELIRRFDALELAWGLIANGYGGWENAPDDWRNAAIRWRDEQYHPILEAMVHDEKEDAPETASGGA